MMSDNALVTLELEDGTRMHIPTRCIDAIDEGGARHATTLIVAPAARPPRVMLKGVWYGVTNVAEILAKWPRVDD